MLAIEDVGNRIPQIAVQFADCLCPAEQYAVVRLQRILHRGSRKGLTHAGLLTIEGLSDCT